MKRFLQQLGTIAGAVIAAACCLGVPVVLSAVAAVGLGFLIRDALLFPLFALMLGANLWLLRRSGRSHRNLAPFWMGAGAAALSLAGLLLLVSGGSAARWLIYAGLAALLTASVWDFLNGRKAGALAPRPSD